MGEPEGLLEAFRDGLKVFLQAQQVFETTFYRVLSCFKPGLGVTTGGAEGLLQSSQLAPSFPASQPVHCRLSKAVTDQPHKATQGCIQGLVAHRKAA